MTARKKITGLISLIIIFCLLTVTFSGCTVKYTERTSFAMGSVLTAKIFTEDEQAGSELFELINTAARETDASLSTTIENSDISVLNREKNTFVSEKTRLLLSDCILLCNMLDRNVDITIGGVTKLWGFSSDTPSVPDKKLLSDAVEAVSVEKVFIDRNSERVTIPDDIELDLGAFGKGAACDAAFDAVRYKYIPLIMTLGGTVMAYGEGPNDGKWTVGIRDPFSDANSYFATLNLAPLSPKNAFFISTSGSYEKTFTENGKTYHHILDPKTGHPVETELVSVTVISSSGLSADALSTALFVEGLNNSSLEALQSFYAEAVFVFKDKTYYVTDSLKDSIKITAEGFTPIEYSYEEATD